MLVMPLSCKLFFFFVLAPWGAIHTRVEGLSSKTVRTPQSKAGLLLLAVEEELVLYRFSLLFFL